MTTRLFPHPDALTILFGQAPELADPTEPWYYNVLTCRFAQAAHEVVCSISPSYATSTLIWRHQQYELVSCDLRGITALEIEHERGRSGLVFRFAEDQLVGPLRLQLNPTIHLFVSVYETLGSL